MAPILVFIAVLYLLYKIWSIAYHLGISKRSPRFVIIALFLPIVNLYYIFKSFLGWALIYNKAVSKLEKEPEEHRMPVFLGFLASIMPFFVIISFIHNYSRPNFFVERSGKYIQVRNREQIKPNEEVYTITNLNILNKGAREDVPSKGEYYFISSIPSLPFLIYDIILILFFKFALDCANHLVNLHKKLSEV